ncbi:uncharacterized protein LOC107046828, partial [Diachasma alloeum]|uniref:uncharacterized protein LOC107046828 n=1 Tax=Diachasma alloeum TaxID=454923 RepID=UPI000738448A
MDKGDYSRKLCAMLDDSRVYTKLRKDPTRTIERQTTYLLKKAGLSADLTKFLTPKEFFPHRLYGLPKTHKESNSPGFVNKLKNLRTSPDDILFEREFYEQKSGAAMGSPISPIIANIFMEHFENDTLKSVAQKPAVWFRYVDDTFVIWPHGRTGLNQFLEFLNAQHPSIKFTMEIEQNGCLPFLDVLVYRNKDGTLGYQLYRKPHRQVKRTLQNKLSSPQEKINPEENREIPKVTLLPYLRGTTERISRVLGKHHIRTIYQPPKKIGQMLPSAKDRGPPLSTPGV